MKIPKRKKVIISTIAASLSIIGISTSLVLQSDKASATYESPTVNAFSLLKDEHKNYKNQKEKHFMKINNKKFTNKDINQFKEGSDLIQRSNGENPLSQDEINDGFIQEVVTYEQAVNEGLAVTKSEAQEFANKVRQMQEENPNDPYGKQFTDNYIKALGISEDDYWNNYAVKAYETALSIGQLKENFIEEIQSTPQTLNAEITSANSVEINESWEKYQKELVNKASIK